MVELKIMQRCSWNHGSFYPHPTPFPQTPQMITNTNKFTLRHSFIIQTANTSQLRCDISVHLYLSTGWWHQNSTSYHVNLTKHVKKYTWNNEVLNKTGQTTTPEHCKRNLFESDREAQSDMPSQRWISTVKRVKHEASSPVKSFFKTLYLIHHLYGSISLTSKPPPSGFIQRILSSFE